MATSDTKDRLGFTNWHTDIDNSRTLSEELPYTAGKSVRNVPVVTVFGGGVAGMTTAHELIERGFRVQLVEPTPDPRSEYDCFVGGLASSQPARLNETRRLHWMLYEPAAQAAYLAAHPELLDIPEEASLNEAKLEREDLMRTIRALREDHCSRSIRAIHCRSGCPCPSTSTRTRRRRGPPPHFRWKTSRDSTG